jgi:hypothetical protein
MQILVLGGHRSGTSMLARLLNMMGAYFAPERVEMPAHLRSANCEWYRIPALPLTKFQMKRCAFCRGDADTAIALTHRAERRSIRPLREK